VPAEQAIEMRRVAEACGERDVDDPQVGKASVGQHGVGPLQAALGHMLGERLPGFLEQTLKISPRQAKRARDVVEIEIGA
jgi:hypothetical protein